MPLGEISNSRQSWRRSCAYPEPVKLFETSGGFNYLCVLLGQDGRPGLVDPYPARQGWGQRAVGEPLGVRCVRVVEDLLAAALDRPGGAVVHRGGGMQPDPGMAVPGVVVGEENVAERAGVLQVSEAAGENRAVLERFELCFGIRVVVRDVRPG